MVAFLKSPFFKTTIFLVALAIVPGLTGCSITTKQDKSRSNAGAHFPKTTNQTKIQKKLAKHFREWERAPYILGGSNKDGIDCSGFVYITYRDVFDTRVPRSTKLLAKTGKFVKNSDLNLGDLVFFKISRKRRHVGIYLGDNKFIHASTSRGVMLSQLDSPYWRSHYQEARRILSL